MQTHGQYSPITQKAYLERHNRIYGITKPSTKKCHLTKYAKTFQKAYFVEDTKETSAI